MATAPIRRGLTTVTAATLRHAPIPLREALRLHAALRRRMALPLRTLPVVAALMAAAAVAVPTAVAAIAEWDCIIAIASKLH